VSGLHDEPHLGHLQDLAGPGPGQRGMEGLAVGSRGMDSPAPRPYSTGCNSYLVGTEDRVADNLAKHEITESESLLIGTDFGVTTDVETGPNGNLFVASLTDGAVYEVFRR
jgi:hypothetical protein